MKTFIFIVVLMIIKFDIKAQNSLPESILSAFPENYKLNKNFYDKSGDITNISIGLEIPSKYGCGKDKASYPPVEIGINIYLNNNTEYADMMEQTMPFKLFLPNKETHKSTNTGYDLVEYSETTIIDLPQGQAAYYTWTRKCVQDANVESYGVSVLSVTGSHSKKIMIGVNGSIDAAEAIETLKEMLDIISKLDFQNL